MDPPFLHCECSTPTNICDNDLTFQLATTCADHEVEAFSIIDLLHSNRQKVANQHGKSAEAVSFMDNESSLTIFGICELSDLSLWHHRRWIAS